MTKRKKLTFWGANENDDSLVQDVIAGRKTVTADTVGDYYKGYGGLTRCRNRLGRRWRDAAARPR